MLYLVRLENFRLIFRPRFICTEFHSAHMKPTFRTTLVEYITEDLSDFSGIVIGKLSSMFHTHIILNLLFISGSLAFSNNFQSYHGSNVEKLSYLNQKKNFPDNSRYNVLISSTMRNKPKIKSHGIRPHPHGSCLRKQNNDWQHGTSYYGTYYDYISYGHYGHTQNPYGRSPEFNFHQPWNVNSYNNPINYGRLHHVTYDRDEHPLVDDINDLLYVTQKGCKFLSFMNIGNRTMAHNTRQMALGMWPEDELRSWLDFMRISGNLVISNPRRYIKKLSCSQAWVRTWEFGTIKYKYPQNKNGDHNGDLFRFIFKEPPVRFLKSKLDHSHSEITKDEINSNGNDAVAEILKTLPKSADEIVARENEPEMQGGKGQVISTDGRTTPRNKRRVWGLYHRQLLSEALVGLIRQQAQNERNHVMRIDLG